MNEDAARTQTENGRPKTLAGILAIASVVAAIVGGYPKTWLLGLVAVGFAIAAVKFNSRNPVMKIRNIAIAGITLGSLSFGLGLTKTVLNKKLESELKYLFGSKYEQVAVSITKYEMAIDANDYRRAAMIARELERYFFSEGIQNEYADWRNKAIQADKRATDAFFNRSF